MKVLSTYIEKEGPLVVLHAEIEHRNDRHCIEAIECSNVWYITNALYSQRFYNKVADEIGFDLIVPSEKLVQAINRSRQVK